VAYSSFSLSCLTRVRGWIVALAIVGFIGSGREAAASCGDYLFPLGAAAEMTHQQAVLGLQDHSVNGQGGLVPIRPTSPCHGASCGQAPNDRAMTWGTPIELRQTSTLLVTVPTGRALVCAAESALAELVASNRLLPCFLVDDLLRPPIALSVSF
jgi:hypothetical protein